VSVILIDSASLSRREKRKSGFVRSQEGETGRKGRGAGNLKRKKRRIKSPCNSHQNHVAGPTQEKKRGGRAN